MPIFQTNLWLCEVCGEGQVTLDKVSPYSDPVIVPPNNEEWSCIELDGEERLACPACVLRNSVPRSLKVEA